MDDVSNRTSGWLGACMRCRGDLFLDLDRYGHFITCLQCGKILTEQEEASLKTASDRDREPAIAHRR